MKIVCAGGGPAGLYFAILAKLRSPRHEVTVVERNAPGTTNGWGVTFGEDFLDDLYRNDPESARTLRGAALLWADQVVRIGTQPPVHLGGKYGYSMGRAPMLEILTERGRQLGVRFEFERELGTSDASPADASPADAILADADLVVAADGAGSRLRSAHAGHFGTTLEPGRNRYIWLGTSKMFRIFTFAFERTAAGWIWFYAYPSAEGASTCIVECSPETWAGLGLDGLEPSAGLRMLEEVFARALDGERLLAPAGGLGAAPWLRFREVRNTTWRRGNMVLMGDAAHTTHFGIGSGTVLAVQDAIALSEALHGAGPDSSSDADLTAALPAALAAYDSRRRAALDPLQAMARRSMSWFENVDAQLEHDAVRFAYSLLDRRGDQAAWRYQLHLATQIDGVRQARRSITSARRSVRALRRGELHPNRLVSRVGRGRR